RALEGEGVEAVILARSLDPVAHHTYADCVAGSRFDLEACRAVVEAVAFTAAEGIDSVAAQPSSRRHDANIAGAHRIAAGEARAVEAAIFGQPFETPAAEGIGRPGRDDPAERLAPPERR